MRPCAVRIRPAVASDEAFILDLAPRLTQFGEVPGRDPTQMAARDRTVLADALAHPTADTELYIAEDDSGSSVGFIHLTTADDYYTGGVTAHIADVVVAPGAESRGIGRALIRHAEEWATRRGFAMLTLNVFLENHRARNVYRRLGFQEEWIRCIKRLH